MHSGNLGLLLLWLQNIEVCLTLSTVQLSKMEYLAKSLTPDECYKLYNLLDYHEERTSVYAIRRNTVPCINLLIARLTSHDRSDYKLQENIELNLRQIGRTDLAHWLGYNIIRQRQLANVKADAGVEESENDKEHVTVQETTSGTLCFSNEEDKIIENYDVKHGFWKISLLISLMLLSVVLFACCYRRFFVKLHSLCQRSEKKERKQNDEESWLREDNHRTRSSCSKGTNVQRDTNESKFKGFSPFCFFTKKYKRHPSNDNVNSCQQIQVLKMEKKRLENSDLDFGCMTRIPSEHTFAHEKSDNDKRNQRIDEIKRKLQSVNYDVRRLNLSKAEHNLFISLSNQELRKMSLTREHVKYYIALDSERKPLLSSSSSQEKNSKIDVSQTKLKCPCDPVQKISKRELLTNLSSEERQRLYMSKSNKSFNSEEKVQQQTRTTELKDANNLDAKIAQLKDKWDKSSNTEMMEEQKILLNSLPVQQMIDTNISPLQIKTSLSNTSEKDITLRKNTFEENKKIRSDTSNVCLSDSEGKITTLSDSKSNMIDRTPSQIKLSTKKSKRKMIQNTDKDKRKVKSTASQSSIKTMASNTTLLTVNEDCRKIQTLDVLNKTNKLPKTLSSITVNSILCTCKAISKKSNVNVHSCVSTKSDKKNETHIPKNHTETNSTIEGSVLMLPETPGTPSGYSNCTECGESLCNSELSDTYDELGMLFSQYMKQQTQPCRRKYCLLGRLLKRQNYHDRKQCHIRHNYYRGYLSDQRPACSSGNVCKDTYDEFNLMYATPNERKQLGHAIHKRRKQFLAQPCVSPRQRVIPVPENNRKNN